MTGASSMLDVRLPQIHERTVLIEQAFRLEWLTGAWMVVEALVAIGSGVVAGSSRLMAFGLDSVIDLISPAVLILRLRDELWRGEEFSSWRCGICQPNRSGGVLHSHVRALGGASSLL